MLVRPLQNQPIQVHLTGCPCLNMIPDVGTVKGGVGADGTGPARPGRLALVHHLCYRLLKRVILFDVKLPYDLVWPSVG